MLKIYLKTKFKLDNNRPASLSTSIIKNLAEEQAFKCRDTITISISSSPIFYSQQSYVYSNYHHLSRFLNSFNHSIYILLCMQFRVLIFMHDFTISRLEKHVLWKPTHVTRDCVVELVLRVAIHAPDAFELNQLIQLPRSEVFIFTFERYILTCMHIYS